MLITEGVGEFSDFLTLASSHRPVTGWFTVWITVQWSDPSDPSGTERQCVDALPSCVTPNDRPTG
jgi:hypothetical protein